MIDIHSHILSGVDDGAQSLEDSLEMARVAAQDGVEAIVATPHDAEWRTGCTLSETIGRVKALQNEVDERGIGLRILHGLEVYLVPKLPQQVADGKAFPLNGSRYILVEIPLHSFPIYTEQSIFELQLSGLVPILAHPERNADIQRDPDLLHTLVERGVLAQITAASLCGDFGLRIKEVCKVLLDRNLVHIIASDAHTPRGNRAPVLSAGVAEAAKIIGKQRAYAMVSALPEAIISDLPVEVEPPLEARRRSWAFWRR